ncbi:uncharacterized protein [Rutidosis leptorrhynchoides]|uniref:uncharacterized protein n=1 Tax=Rutidosis leptorrhynchoides TaxID=125765 RepID=UPI003A9905C3
MTVWCDGHNYDGVNNEREDRNISQNHVAHVIFDKIRDRPNYPIKSIVSDRESAFNCKIEKKKAWDGKRVAMNQLYGDWETNFRQLPSYMRALEHCNDGTKVQWKFNKEDGIVYSWKKIFRYVFWYFGATKCTFQHSHPTVTVDATHLCGAYKGKAVVAIVKTANNRVVPVAYAIIDEESNHIWYCMEHARANMMGSILKKKGLYDLCWAVGTELDEAKYMKALADLIDTSLAASTYLQRILLEKWTLFLDGFHKWGVTTSNDTESYNNVLRGDRFLPIRAFVQATQAKAMAIFAYELMKINRYRSALVPISSETFDANKMHARRYEISLYPNTPRRTFSVRSSPLRLGVAGSEHTVRFDMGSCTYLIWDTYRIPCSHAMAVAKILNVLRLDLVHRCYTRDGWRQHFSDVFHPLPNYWPEFEFLLLPDDSRMIHHTGRGRKRINRRQLGSRDYANRIGPKP